MIDGELLAVIAARAALAPEALAPLAGALGQEARRCFADLCAREPEERTRRSARVLAAVASPVPASARRAHREWLEAALTAEPEAATVLSAPSQSPAAVWLARRAFAAFPLTALSASEQEGLAGWLRRRGALALAVVVRDRRATVAAAMAQLAEAGEDEVAALALAVRRLERGEAEAPMRRAAVAACHGVDLRRPEALLLIGVASSARELRQDAARWRAALVGLPRAVGLAIAELIE